MTGAIRLEYVKTTNTPGNVILSNGTNTINLGMSQFKLFVAMAKEIDYGD